MYQYKDLMHCGNQILLAHLREKYWILKGRKSIRKILNSFILCRRFNSRSVKMSLLLLPEDRIKDTDVFEVSGVDLASPLFLRNGSKDQVMSIVSINFNQMSQTIESLS